MCLKVNTNLSWGLSEKGYVGTLAPKFSEAQELNKFLY